MSLRRRCCLVLGLSLLISLLSTAHAQVSKGNWILLNRGLQIQGLVTPDNYFHLDVYSNANYTTVNFFGSSSGNLGPIDTFVGPTPGFPWARWANDETNMPGMGFNDNGVPRANEIPYTNQLVHVQLGDEWNLNDDTIRTRLVNWFLSVKTNWPNTILYHNNWGSQIGDSQLGDFYTRAQPDMLCFDTYPWQSVWDGNQPDHIGATISGPPTGWYGDLRRYREHAKGANIPLAIYRQTFHAVQDYDSHVFRDPSPSELRLNTFAALAFNVKFFSDFVYNPGAGSLFTKTFNGSGDSVISTNGLYAEITDINKRAQNLGRALVCLTPIYDIHNQNNPNPPPGPPSADVCACLANGVTTSIMFVRGRFISGGVTNFTAVPNSFQNDTASPTNAALPNPLTYTWWETPKNDPYMTGFGVTNKAAVKNNGLPGDAIIAWFKPLDENLDGTNYNNELYMMVVNGLTDPTGTAADCLQEIHLDFNGLSGAMTNLIMLDPVSGQLQTNGLPLVSSKRRLTLNLNGGDAALFKFNTGAPFVGFVQPTAPRLTAEKQASNMVVRMEGALGARYILQAASSLFSPNWTTLTNIVLTSSPYAFSDSVAPDASTRYYRAVGIRP